ncbi:cell division protein FtsL [Simiduia curdlanivorans]|uniref:Cell division protein FtsL n=1 Tax=Simiduia curdlanivorans TaxID=1492769 RepID=A0ABV8VA76_9GAMM|nr:cell division protein FtsL [Simiduia curdlanivorans]MDN3638964.1 cell division protein FtsL [Simiduia curdlanivorans]
MQNPIAVKDQPKAALVLITVLLWLLVAASALLVVRSTHDARIAFFQLESLRREAGELEVQRGQYLLEQSTWAAYSRVEKLAVEKLQMRLPDAASTIMVQP